MDSLRRDSTIVRRWRAAILARDGNRCQDCGAEASTAHHIYPWRDWPDLRAAPTNGIALCAECHKRTFGKEYRYVNHYAAMIGGKR